MYNQQVQWTSGKTDYVGADGDYAWAYTPLKYWPNDFADGNVDDQDPAAQGSTTYGGNVSFFAYAPYVSEATGSEGITGMTANNESSDPILTYTVASAGNDIVDLLWGTAGANGENVVGSSNSGVAYKADGTAYQQSILPSYKMNADLTKQKTQGLVSFNFKHALSKVGGSNVTTSPATTNGLMIKLDLDDGKGAENNGTKEDATLVTVKEISIVAKAKSAASGDDKYYQTAQSGKFNLANGNWKIESTTGTSTSAATTTHIINQSGTGTNVAGKLNTDIAEDNISYSSGWKHGTTPAEIAGVTTTAKNVYATEAAPLVYIPGTYPELTITIDYYVRTYDGKVAGGYSEVEQVITKTLTFAQAVQLNKQYNLLIHLGLTGVKFTATVENWDLDADGNGSVELEGGDTQSVNLPINVQ